MTSPHHEVAHCVAGLLNVLQVVVVATEVARERIKKSIELVSKHYVLL